MKFKKRFFILLIIFLSIFPVIGFAAEPDVASTSALLVEASTGKVLYEKNAHDKMYPASTTKVLTAILVLENCDLNEIATVSHNAVYSLPSGYVNANLQKGEEMSVNDLMYALMVKSANDAAIVLAEHIGGSVEGFAEMMNKKAVEIGCKNTHFVNPNGIHHDNHYTTAYDLYLIAAYAMKNETFRSYVSTTSYTLPITNKYPSLDRYCVTTNDMLRPKSKYYNENIIGIKTGYTTEAKNCLIAGAQKNGVELISVVLHSGTNSAGLSERYVDTAALMNYGFDNFQFSNIIKQHSVIQNIEIENGSKKTRNLELVAKDTLTAYLNKETDFANLSPEVTLNEDLKAPIIAGESVGTITYTVDNIQYTTKLLAKSNVDKKLNIAIFIILGALILLGVGILILIKHPRKKLRKKKTYRK